MAQTVPDFLLERLRAWDVDPVFGFPGDGTDGLRLLVIRVERPEDVGPAWQPALSPNRPAVVEFLTDACVPPIPPRASWDQIEHATEAVVPGDSDSWDLIKEGVKTKVREFLPGTES